MEIDLAWLLLLPVLFSLGWSIARYDRFQRRGELDRVSQHVLSGMSAVLSKDYSVATDELIKAAGLAPDSPELHRAVGSLYRARGLVDRAIEVHETALLRPQLSVAHRAALMLDLARDYMAAGLFDRAEDVLVDLLNHSIDGKSFNPLLLNHARVLLIDLFQKTRDWARAIYWAEEAHRCGADFGHHTYQQLMGHFHCEIAEVALASNDVATAESALSIAETFDSSGVAQRCADLRVRISGGAVASATAVGVRACSVCGFRTKNKLWSCPACHRWDSFLMSP